MKLLASWVAALIVALLAIWLLMRGDPAPVPPAAEAPPAEPAAALEPETAAAGSLSSEFERNALPARAEEAATELRVRFRDLVSGVFIAPRAVVVLEEDGTRRVATLEKDGSLLIPVADPSVLAAAFAEHLPLLALVLPDGHSAEFFVNACPAARLTVEFEGCDATVLPTDARLELGSPGLAGLTSRSGHGQSLLQRLVPSWTQAFGLPRFELEPEQWFTAQQADGWRKSMTDDRFSRPREDSQVHAVMLHEFDAERPITGQALIWDAVPAGFEMSWRTDLPLRQLEPETAPGTTTFRTDEGGRWGTFEVARGGTTLRLAWAPGGSITGRIPIDGLDGAILAPLVRLHEIVRGGESSPANGQLANQQEGKIDPVDGSFRFVDLPPGEYQVMAAWSAGSDVFVSSARALLAAGQSQDLGICPVRPGEALRLDLRMRDLHGNPLRPDDVFLSGLDPRCSVSVKDHTKDALEPTFGLELSLPHHSSLRLHGLHAGFVWINPRSQPEAESLKQGAHFVRFVPNGDRITFPETDGLTMHAEFQVGAVATTLRFEFPEDGLDRSYTLYLAHLASGTKIPTYSLGQALRPRQRVTEGIVHLMPGQYEAVLLSSMAMQAPPGEVHHYAFANLSVESDGRPITLKLEPGLEAAGPADSHALRSSGDSALFMLRSIGGTKLVNQAIIVGKFGAGGQLRFHGVPRGAVLQQNRDPISWVVNESGILAPLR